MAGHLHKSFSDHQVKALLKRYVDHEISLKHVLSILKIGRSRFFEILKTYRDNPLGFTVTYQRKSRPRKLAPAIENNILYSYIRDRLWNKYRQKVSVPTIIKRAKEHDFYLSKPARKAHDREVLTNYVGELIQHDSSYHKWAPDSGVKWHLITSLDDYSRLLLYADFVDRETSWTHISALEKVVLKYGFPFSALFRGEIRSGESITW